MQLVTLGFAIFVVFRRPHDPAARIGAWLLGSLAVISMVLPYRIADVCRSLPDLTIAFVAVPYASSVAVGALLFTFYATFPRPLFKSPSIWALVWTPMLVVAAWHLWYGYRLIYDPTRSSDIPDWSASVIGVNALYLIAGIWILVRNSARLKDANERRRAAVLVIGTVIGCAAGAPVVAHYWLGPTANLAGSVFASRTVIVGTLLFLAFPMSFAYAILRHRLFDVSIMIRQGVRYALARRVVLSCAPAVAIVLAIDLLAHGDRPLIGLLQTRIGIYGAIVAFGVLAHVRRQQWLVSLDRRFFRERYKREPAAAPRRGRDPSSRRPRARCTWSRRAD